MGLGNLIGAIGVAADQVAELVTEVGQDRVAAAGGVLDVGADVRDLYSIVVHVVTAAQVR